MQTEDSLPQSEQPATSVKAIQSVPLTPLIKDSP